MNTSIEANITNDDEVEPTTVPEYIAWTSLVLCTIILAVGILGNLLVIIVILTSKVLRSSTNLFLLNLSVADLLVLATCTPTSIVESIKRSDAWYMGKAMCYVVPFVELSVSHTSILTILAITVERYYAICQPLKASMVCTKRKACLTCLIVWIFAFGLTSPILAMVEYQASSEDLEDPVCYTNAKEFWQKFYFIFIITVFFFIPLVILILLYMKIARNLVPSPVVTGEDRTPEQVVAAAESASISRSRKQVVTMLMTVVIFFFACMLPFKLLTLWIITLSEDVLTVINIETFYLLLYFCRVMFYINSAINPILYNIMSSKFREGFRKVFHCINWPLTPKRLRMAEVPGGSHRQNLHRRQTSSHEWIRNRTVTSATSLSVPRSPRDLTTSPLIAKNPKANTLTTTVAIEQSPQFSDTEGATKRRGRRRQKRTGEQEEESFRHQEHHHHHHHHHGTTMDGSKNIVFIEERKILVIPTSTQSGESSQPPPNV